MAKDLELAVDVVGTKLSRTEAIDLVLEDLERTLQEENDELQEKYELFNAKLTLANVLNAAKIKSHEDVLVRETTIRFHHDGVREFRFNVPDSTILNTDRDLRNLKEQIDQIQNVLYSLRDNRTKAKTVVLRKVLSETTYGRDLLTSLDEFKNGLKKGLLEPKAKLLEKKN